MKEKIFKKLICVLIIICMLAMIFVPNFAKSATVVVSNMSNTGHGIGNTSIFTVKINGYSNLYCVRGGASLRTGMQLNDGGLSLYTTTGAVVTNSSAMQWLLDNMYLTEGTDANTKKEMRQNLINIMKKYNTYKDSNGNSLLNKKLKGNGINNEWITKAVDDVINDKLTLYAVQQYAIWNHVKNTYNSYYNTMQNSDGSYNAIPGAKASRVHYTALYITLNELAAEAQKNGYKSPNNSGRGFDVKIEKQSNTKATISSDGKSVLVGPYKLKNNHGIIKKSFSATINSDKADKVETVNAEGKGTNVSESQKEFYVKITYNKGFAKGTEYKIGINVGLSGYRTFATLLDTSNGYNQPLATIRKEPVKTNTKAEIVVKEELKGDYNLELEKISNGGEKISGVTFKVKEGSGEAKTYGPTDSNGNVKVVTKKKIEKEGIDEYTITEVNVGSNKLVKVQEEIKLYVTKVNANGKYVASKVSFEKEKEIKETEVRLED
ncbi:MAG: Cys-Gln thioester bond-forming surface protein, partial [Clostridia bacterium]|nr:Cys-Gln thioester bond-forming surface protein [Clostridia bacterium]